MEKLLTNSITNNFWKLKAIRMFFWMHFFSAVIVPFYTDWGGLTLTQILFVNSWFMFWTFALEVPTGTVADFLGRKVSLIVGCIVAGAAALIYVSYPSLKIFLVAEFVFAIAFTLHSGADEALAYDSLKAVDKESESKVFFSAMESFKLGGIIVAAIIGGFVATRFGLDAPMKAYTIPAFLALLIALTLKEPPIESKISEKQKYVSILHQGFRFFVTNKILMLLTFELAITNALAWGIIWLYQAILANAGLPIKYFGIVHALAALGEILLLSNVIAIEQWLGSKRKLLLWMNAMAGISFVALSFFRNLPIVIVAIIFSFTFSLPRIPIFSSYINKYVPSDKRATILSVTSMIRTFSIVIINPIVGLLADWSLSYTMAILGGLILVTTVLSRIEEHHLID